MAGKVNKRNESITEAKRPTCFSSQNNRVLEIRLLKPYHLRFGMRTIFIFALLLGTTLAPAQEREFTNIHGKSITAEVETVRGGKVYLKMRGKRFTVPYSELSKQDQDYVRGWVKENHNYKFSYRIKKEHTATANQLPPTMGTILTTGKVKKIEASTARYSVDIENRSGIDVDRLIVEYRVFVRNTSISDPTYGKKSKTERPTKHTSKMVIGSIANSKRHSFKTIGIPVHRKKWETKHQSYISSSDGSSRLEEYWDNHESETELDGIWIRVYRGKKLIDEYKSEGKMIKDATW